jgi:hypothetical protein
VADMLRTTIGVQPAEKPIPKVHDIDLIHR